MSMKGCVEMKLKKYILTTIIFALLVPLIAACSESAPAMSAEERAEERQRILDDMEPSPILGNPIHFRSIDAMASFAARLAVDNGEPSPQIIRVEVLGDGVTEYQDITDNFSMRFIVTEVRVLEVFLGDVCFCQLGNVANISQKV